MTDKSLPQPGTPQASSRTFTPYVVTWASLATLSLLYLVLLAVQPAFVAGLLGAPTTLAEAGAESPASAAEQALAETRALRESVDMVRDELVEIKAQIASQVASAKKLATRVASLETPADDGAHVADAAAKGTAAQPAKKAAEPASKVAAAQKAAKEAAAKEAKAAKKKSAELETGSVAQPAAGAISFGPATVTTAAAPPEADITRQVGVQIATGPSVDSLRLSWTLLNERHGDSLRAFEPRYTTDASGPNQSYDLVVGPLANADEARRLCQELALKATPCSVSRFTGSAL